MIALEGAMILVLCKTSIFPAEPVRSGDPVPLATEHISGSSPHPIPLCSHSNPSTKGAFPSNVYQSFHTDQTTVMQASLSNTPSSQILNTSVPSTSTCAHGRIGHSVQVSQPIPSHVPTGTIAADSILLFPPSKSDGDISGKTQHGTCIRK
jgi:hypothetical protein